ncbi:glycosyltransferase [Nesterenkonia alba]|uniref:glycosyltransferase n=1 Tax=Nesterenkonia alba TaxID=515814 RepID=UPI0003B64BF6|nr:glycosyltransferase [Nesterenkonia alba]
MSRITPLRRAAGRLYRRARGDELSRLRDELTVLAGEVNTLSAQYEALLREQEPTGVTGVKRVDVAMLSDLRLPGGTTASMAQEARAQSAAGLRTALIHAQSGITSLTTGFSDHIRGVMSLPGVHIVSARQQLEAKVLIIRHPKVLATTPVDISGIRAEHVVVVANHPAVDAAGQWHYDVAGVNAELKRMIGTDPVWAPISPVVRTSIAEQGAAVRLDDGDWVNIFGEPVRLTPREGFTGRPPVIGRHSRPQREKWPATAEAILSAYPEGEDYQVKILGGAQVPEQILGRVPQTWQVADFGAEKPDAFLAGVDFWVYMHHPDWREAYGRAIIEAMAAGCVVVLPPYLEAIYAEAALYAEPDEVLSVIAPYRDDVARFLQQSRTGQQFAQGCGPQTHLQRLARFAVTPPQVQPPASEQPEAGEG